MNNIILSPDDNHKKNGTAVIPIEEYNRLRAVEKQYDEVCADLNAIILEDGWYNNRRILNPSEAVKIAAAEGQKSIYKYNDLKERRIPILNLRRRKVKDLL